MAGNRLIIGTDLGTLTDLGEILLAKYRLSDLEQTYGSTRSTNRSTLTDGTFTDGSTINSENECH
jgi:hypothetical protein|nr:hypothetical protein Q903MT_gene4676 [Picea sitchensis]